MKIIVAKKIGFCFGVRRSINLAKQALAQEKHTSVLLLGAIVHNEEVMAEIVAQGGKIINSLEEASQGSLVITKAHGVSQKTVDKAERRKIEIKNTTCPIVRLAQKKAEALASQGCQVIIIGEKDHPETQVIKECAGRNAIITESESEIKKLKPVSLVGVVAQTTKKREEVKELLKLIKSRGGKVKWEDTICNEVSDRQEELKQILKQTEGILVIGSKTSANTTRLTEITKNSGQKLWWINSAREIPIEEIKKFNTIGVVSGTSAPDWEVEKIIKTLKEL